MTAMLQLNDVFDDKIFAPAFPYNKSTNLKNYSPTDPQFSANHPYSDVNIWCPPFPEGHFQAKPSGKLQMGDRRPEKLSLTLPPIGRPHHQRKAVSEIDRLNSHRDEPWSAQSRSNQTDSTVLTPSSRSMSDSGYSTSQGESNTRSTHVQTTNSKQPNDVENVSKWDQIGEFRPSLQMSRPSAFNNFPTHGPIGQQPFTTRTIPLYPNQNGYTACSFYASPPINHTRTQAKFLWRGNSSGDSRAHCPMDGHQGFQATATGHATTTSARSDPTLMRGQQYNLIQRFQRLDMSTDTQSSQHNNPSVLGHRSDLHGSNTQPLGYDGRRMSQTLQTQDNKFAILPPVNTGTTSRLSDMQFSDGENKYTGHPHPRSCVDIQGGHRRQFFTGYEGALYSTQGFDIKSYSSLSRVMDNPSAVGTAAHTTAPPLYNISGQEIGEEQESAHIIRSEMLEDFRMNHKTRKFEFREIRGYIVEFSGDQLGSRFIQHKLETANSEEKDQVFAEIAHDARQLMTDVFGNYVIQKLFEHGNQSQKKVLGNQMRGHILALSTHPYGCRVVQKAFEHVLTDQQASLVGELDGHVLQVVENQNGNHVIQKAIECIPGEYVDFIVHAHRGHVHYLSKHSYGCRVIQRMLEYCQPQAKRLVLDELHHDIGNLIQDPFGNYVVQHVIVNGEPSDRKPVIDKVQVKLLDNAMHKFASNVVEKAMDYADEVQRNSMLRKLTSRDEHGQSVPTKLLNHQFGNYVIQKAVAYLHGAALHNVVEDMDRYLVQLRRVSSGKQVMALEETIRSAKLRLDPLRPYNNQTGVPTQPSRYHFSRR